jgi:hypothetical protein
VHETGELAAAPLATHLGIPHATVAFSGWLPDAVLERGLAAAQPLWSMVDHDVPADLGVTTYAYFHPFSAPLGEAPSLRAVHGLRPGLVDGAGLYVVPEWIDRVVMTGRWCTRRTAPSFGTAHRGRRSSPRWVNSTSMQW